MEKFELKIVINIFSAFFHPNSAFSIERIRKLFVRDFYSRMNIYHNSDSCFK
jgi:hypothetical protein